MEFLNLSSVELLPNARQAQVWLILLKKQPRLMYDICILYIFAV